jgi:isoquinoline 1-oxidoreductase subunit beta
MATSSIPTTENPIATTENSGVLAPVNRRQFVARGTAAVAGLLIGIRLTPFARAQENEKGPKKRPPNPFDAWIHVKPDGEISLVVAKSEMGQGIRTGLAMILAEGGRCRFQLRQSDSGGNAP